MSKSKPFIVSLVVSATGSAQTQRPSARDLHRQELAAPWRPGLAVNSTLVLWCAAVLLCGGMLSAIAAERTIEFVNNTGREVNDLHIIFKQKVRVVQVTPFPAYYAIGDDKGTEFGAEGATVKPNSVATVTVSSTSEEITISQWWWTIGGLFKDEPQGRRVGPVMFDPGKKLSCHGKAAAGDGAILVSIGGVSDIFRTGRRWQPVETLRRFSSFLRSFRRSDGFQLIALLEGPDAVEFRGNILGDPDLELRAEILSPDSGQTLVLEELDDLWIEQIAPDEITIWWSGGFLQEADQPDGPWVDISDATSPWTNWLTGPEQPYYRIRRGPHPGYGKIIGTVTDPNGRPVPGLSVGVRGTDNRTMTDPNGSFTLTNIMAGKCFFDVFVTVEFIEDRETKRVKLTMPVTVPVRADDSSVVDLKVQFVCCDGPPPPACTDRPWCGVVGGTIDGQRKVVAGGGVHGEGNATIVITPPPPAEAITQEANQHRRTFSPAAAGTWTVTVTVCGQTRICSITLR